MKRNVTILMSTYNGEKYLSEQIDSIFNQVGVNSHLIVRDDGSKDSTVDIINEKKKIYDISLIEGENIGFAKSFWKLIQDSPVTDYYAFCDQDDIWLEDKLISAIEQIGDEKIPVLYTNDVMCVDENTNRLSEKRFAANGVISYADSLKRNVLPGCTYVFNRQLIEMAKKYEGEIIAHDWLIYIIANGIGKVVYDPIPHMKYRIHSNNAIGIDSKSIWLRKKILLLFKNDFPNARSVIAGNVYSAFSHLMSEKNKELTYCFSNYRTNKECKKKLYEYPEFQEDLIFRLMLFLKKV